MSRGTGEAAAGRTPVVVGSLLEARADAAVRRIAALPAGCGLVEIRGDRMSRGELVAAVQGADRPAIVTLRRPQDGGAFDGSEDERRRLLIAGLDAGAAWIDVEHDGELRDLANGPLAGRTILSHHGSPCEPEPLARLYREMASTAAARLKIVPRAERVGEAAAVRDLLSRAASDGRPLACFALGRAGAVTRLFGPAWGAWATYGAVLPGRETAPGQFTVADLLDVHDVLGIGPTTRRFALVGSAVSGSPSPAIHRAGYLQAGLDARYVPLELDRLEDVLPLVGPDGLVGLEALAVTMPFKEDAARRCARLCDVSRAAGAVNTVDVRQPGWRGYNTDGPALLELVRGHVELRGSSVAIVGAGGTARVAASVLREAGAEVTLYNRSAARGRAAAAELGVQASRLEALAEAAWEVLVQATPLGRRGETIVSPASLRGRVVVDAVYGVETPLVAAARARGLAVVDGYDLLVGQAVRQFERMTGAGSAVDAMRDAGRAWLAGFPPQDDATELDGPGDPE